MNKRKVIKSHNKTDSKKSIPIKVAQVLGAFIGALAIINLGFQCVWYIKTGNYFGHLNYWYQPVGTLLIAAVLITMLAVGIFEITNMLIKTFNKK
jgi:glycerol uptake facilitator-like aquaporin